MYEMRAEPSLNRATLVLTGDYSHEREAVHRDLKDAVTKARSESGLFDLLVDMTDIPVIAQDRVESAAALMQWCVASGMRRGAMAVATMTQEMQLKRVSDRHEKFQYFRSLDEATHWLDTPSEAQ